MKKIIELENWKRKEHFRFFSSYDNPFFGLVANVNCTKAYQTAKKSGYSFFLYYMHKSLLAVNQIEPFRYRIENGLPVVYDAIQGSTTVMNDNELFSFAFLPYYEDFERFYQHASDSVNKAKKSTGLGVDTNNSRVDVIHYSTVPWVSFTSVMHEYNTRIPDSIPKITFGKYFEADGQLLLPVAVDVHHGLMDGLHVGMYYQLFQQLLDN